MSIMYAALNPNISDAQLLELIKKDGESKAKVFDTFEKCIDSLETAEQKIWYFNACFPVVLQMLIF